jgi:hypothetical protein
MSSFFYIYKIRIKEPTTCHSVKPRLTKKNDHSKGKDQGRRFHSKSWRWQKVVGDEVEIGAGSVEERLGVERLVVQWLDKRRHLV